MFSFPIAAWWAGGQRRKNPAALASGHALDKASRGNRRRVHRGEQAPTPVEGAAGPESCASPQRKILESLPLGLAVISLVLGCLLAPPLRGYWIDEHFTHFGLSQPSLADTISLSGDLLNASPPMYFILAWGWKYLFGMSALSLHLFSCLACIAAMVSLWTFLKKVYTPIAASIGVITTFFFCQGVLFHSKESRHYGLYLLEVTLLLILHCRINVREIPSIRSLGGLTLLHALLVTTHYFGVPYSGMLLLATLAYRLMHGLPLARICTAVVLGWLAFLPCLPGLWRHLEFSNPHGWIAPPTQNDLWKAFSGQIAVLPVLMMILVFFIAVLFLSGHKREPSPPRHIGPEVAGIRLSLLLSGAAFLAVPVVTWLKSIYFAPMFLDRYVLPTVLIWAILVTHVVDLIWSRLNPRPKSAVGSRWPEWAAWLVPRGVLLCALLAALPQPILHSVSRPNVRQSAEYDAVAAAFPGPIVLENEHLFLDCIAYSPDAHRYFLVLDWEVAISPHAGRHEVNCVQCLGTCRRRCAVPNILTTEEFFERFSTFSVIRKGDCGWSKVRILKNPAWQVESCEINRLQVLRVTKAPLTTASGVPAKATSKAARRK